MRDSSLIFFSSVLDDTHLLALFDFDTRGTVMSNDSKTPDSIEDSQSQQSDDLSPTTASQLPESL